MELGEYPSAKTGVLVCESLKAAPSLSLLVRLDGKLIDIPIIDRVHATLA